MVLQQHAAYVIQLSPQLHQEALGRLPPKPLLEVLMIPHGAGGPRRYAPRWARQVWALLLLLLAWLLRMLSMLRLVVLVMRERELGAQASEHAQLVHGAVFQTRGSDAGNWGWRLGKGGVSAELEGRGRGAVLADEGEQL